MRGVGSARAVLAGRFRVFRGEGQRLQLVPEGGRNLPLGPGDGLLKSFKN